MLRKEAITLPTVRIAKAALRGARELHVIALCAG
jgi:hypothetical protein